jgi:SAM-dependent methyltransferase
MSPQSQQEPTQERPVHEALVAGQFDPRAEAYLKSVVHARGPDLEDFARLIGKRPEARALDLGCGGGHVAFLLAGLVGEVAAVDLSPTMTATVAAEAKRRGLANLDVRQAAVEALPWADATFDIVVSRYSAHHWRDIGAGLEEARRVLKPGGLAVFMDSFSPVDPLLDTWLQGLELLRDPSHVRNLSLAQWRAQLAAAGLTPAEASTYRLHLDFAQWIARMNTPAVFVTAIRALQAKADGDVARHFAIEADGSFTIDTMLMTAAG